MTNLELRVQEILKADLVIPEYYDEMILDTLASLPEREVKNNYINKLNKFKACLVAICCTLFLATGIVFASEIIAFIRNIFNNSLGIDKAVQNGYIQELNIETLESNGTTITAENFLMDDFNLSFTFNVKLENEDILKDVSKVEFADMIVTDENKNILYADNKEIFDKYCKENDLNYEYDQMLTAVNKRVNNIKDNNINLVYNLYSTGFPKSKKLYIDISKIKCNKEDDIIINGEWKICLEVPEKFYNRERTVYTTVDCNNSEINSISLEVYNTATKFEFNAKFKELYFDEDSKMQKMHEEYVINGKKIVEEIYIEGESGRIYYPVKSSTEDLNYHYTENGDVSYSQTFDLIQCEKENRLKIYFNINLPNEIKHVEIELERNS